MGTCTRSPTIIGYSQEIETRTMTMIYSIQWKLAPCQNGGIVQYQIQFSESCNSTQPTNQLSDKSSTSAQITVVQCAGQRCYIRIRAELLNGLFSDYSTCVQINNNQLENESELQIIIIMHDCIAS